MSTAAEDDKDYVKAYEVLADLTPSQQKMVAERLDSLKDRYIQAATARARDLERINTPIKGVANEQGIQRAYELLSRCHALTNDPGIEDRMAILGGRLSDYYWRRRTLPRSRRTERAPMLAGHTLRRHCSTTAQTRARSMTK